MPPAPPTFSTITCWPSVSESLRATMRPSTSVPPPGANGTTMRHGARRPVLRRRRCAGLRHHQDCESRSTKKPHPRPPRRNRSQAEAYRFHREAEAGMSGRRAAGHPTHRHVSEDAAKRRGFPDIFSLSQSSCRYAAKAGTWSEPRQSLGSSSPRAGASFRHGHRALGRERRSGCGLDAARRSGIWDT